MHVITGKATDEWRLLHPERLAVSCLRLMTSCGIIMTGMPPVVTIPVRSITERISFRRTEAPK
jgi:hypothetical protein